MRVRDKDSYSIQSVENALALLEALGEEGESIRVSRLSEKLGMNKTSVFRLLATFESRGYVEREDGTGRYRLGLSAYEIGQKFLSGMGLLRKARPVMERLVREFGEAVYVAVRRGEEVLLLDMIDTPQQVKIVPLVGRRHPLAATSAGRVLLAFAAERAPEAAGAELLRIRQEGCCVDRDSLGEGIAAAAVPLLNAAGTAAAALALVAPDFRLPPEKIIGEIVPRLKEAGEVVSSKLGYLGHHLGRERF